ncbi:Stm1p KNAG_0A04940 [Huiozyma naganishii CBS 8797]|uniref:Hyaluronan/mRNA-binding protein domain-containing protein n=1 Tax=Huiozyma naganishii (strain ATCC MYA-139 / BCRC 22969 / CBS 8797 / KCTC 17520 / NBRC 10181 / NCYC 3082 / Yp74L-3) TaxID=1071383 RepID=J7RTS3_HUIN7|nr:hypothetical protein KNAG_0A04940 [Kazachstania naganishii CBS 8797]CCK68162.1 hypothetical protein KNAG_0A04940 [Kazachstania naganishii CBS 8797]
MSNPFDLLGNDIEDPSAAVVVPPKEITKKNTSSKKADVPPPSANPARANKNRKGPTGNEGALKDKTAGRQNNRSQDVPSSGAARRDNSRKQTDRHSRTGKADTGKRVRQGWGDDKKELASEQAAEADAEAEIEADSEEKKSAIKNISLEDYLKTQDASALDKHVEAKKVEPLENAKLFVKEEEVFVAPTKVKTTKSKQLKTKQFLDFDVSFKDNNSQGRPRRNFDNDNRNRNNNNRNNDSRRGGKAPRKPKTNSNGNAVEKDNSIDTMNLPTLA